MYVRTIALRQFLRAQNKTETPEISQFLRDIDMYDLNSGIIDFKTLACIVPNVTYIVCILTASEHYETFVNSGRFSKVLSKWEEYTLDFLKEYLSSSGKSYPPENIEMIANISANLTGYTEPTLNGDGFAQTMTAMGLQVIRCVVYNKNTILFFIELDVKKS